MHPTQGLPIESQFIVLIIGLMAVAIIVSQMSKYLSVSIPYPVAMLIAGLGVGWLRQKGVLQIGDIALDPHIVLIIFLPGLLFEAAYHLKIDSLRENARIIIFLAVPGVLISMTIVGALVSLGLSLPIELALLFGIVVFPTNPVAVFELFKELNVNKRLSLLLEGESLLNDGVAIVLFGMLVGVVTGTEELSLAQGLVDFSIAIIGGIGLGWLVGMAFSYLMSRIDNHLLDIALTFILAYGTFLLASDILHGAISPEIAVVVAGLYVGARAEHSATSDVTIVSFWEFVVFLINSAIYLLIGMELEPILFTYIGEILLVIAAILLARAVMVRLLYIWLGLGRHRPKTEIPERWEPVIFWSGLRGAVSMVLALNLPSALESAEQLKVMALGYVLFSLLVQGPTIRFVIKRQGLSRTHKYKHDYERCSARLAMTQASIHAFEELYHRQLIPRVVHEEVQARMNDRLESLWHQLRDLVSEHPELIEDNVRFAWRESATVQKQAIIEMVQMGTLSEEIYDELAAELDEIIEGSYREDWEPPSQSTHRLAATGTNDPQTSSEATKDIEQNTGN